MATSNNVSMNAAVSTLRLCSTCKCELPTPTPDICPHCGSRTPPTNQLINNRFDCPYFLTHQFEDLLKEIIPKAEDAGITENIEKQKLHRELIEWVRQSSSEDKLACILDSSFIMSELLHSHVSGDILKNIVCHAKRVGKIAEAIDQYINAGGSVQPLPIVSPRPEDTSDLLTTNNLDIRR